MLDLKLQYLLNTSISNADGVEEMSPREEVFSKVCEVYKGVTGEPDCNSESTIENLDEKQANDIISQSVEIFNIDEAPEPGSIKTIGDLVQYILEHKGASVENILRNGWKSIASSEGMIAIDSCLNQLRNSSVSTDGLNITNIFTSVADSFLGICNTFKTNMFRFYKSVKRSEIKKFSQSNVVLIRRVENSDFTRVMDTNINIPSGMKGTYVDTIGYVIEAYELLKCDMFAASVRDELKRNRSDICNSKMDYAHGFVPCKENKVYTDGIDEIIKRQPAMFADRSNITTKKFQEVYKSMSEFKDARLALMDMEQYLDSTVKMTATLDDISLMLGDITSYVSKTEAASQQYVKELTETIRLLSTVYDAYGQNAMRQMALEHNHVLNYSILYKLV